MAAGGVGGGGRVGPGSGCGDGRGGPESVTRGAERGETAPRGTESGVGPGSGKRETPGRDTAAAARRERLPWVLVPSPPAGAGPGRAALPGSPAKGARAGSRLRPPAPPHREFSRGQPERSCTEVSSHRRSSVPLPRNVLRHRSVQWLWLRSPGSFTRGQPPGPRAGET